MKIILKQGQRLWFISDPHYNHLNICRGISKWPDVEKTRNFKSVEHMNDIIVHSINTHVVKNDILFCLGDWSFGGFEKIQEFRNRIICNNIHLILGNHDHYIERNRENIQNIFSSVNYYLRLHVVSQYTVGVTHDTTFVLMHYPIASWHGIYDGVIHLHGHVHLPFEKRLNIGKAMDVGMDGSGFCPISLEQILKIMEQQPIANFSFSYHHYEK